ncbi:Thiol:disulfide interchange protein DsbD [uncultured archaeon]|nr:Thiol:disulfide interchange protein DsbD [uncultured archaeon]
MKKWIFAIPALLVLFSGCLDSQSASPDPAKITIKGLEFYTNLAPALDAAGVQGKPVFVYAQSEFCGWCRKFEEETFTNTSVINILNENFILVSIDVDRQKNETRNFRVHGTPTEIFLDPKGTEIRRIPGYTDTETFLNTIIELKS